LGTGAEGGQERTGHAALAQAAAESTAAGDGLQTVVSGYVTNESAAALKAGLPGGKALLGSAPADGACEGLACLDEADVSSW
jgi:hypothetical protein